MPRHGDGSRRHAVACWQKDAAAELDVRARGTRGGGFVKKRGFSYGAGGMALTEEGWALLQMQALCRAFSGINELEQALSARLASAMSRWCWGMPTIAAAF